MDRELQVDEFLFRDLEDSKLAEKEKKKVDYLNANINFNDVDNLQKCYEKLNEEKIFRTPVGISYMQKLRETLLQHGVEENQIPAITIYAKISSVRKNLKSNSKNLILVNKKKIKYSIFINILLALAIISMFFITLNSKNPNIINYEKALQNKYAEWEQDLSEREEIVRENERRLNIEAEVN